MRDFRDEAGIGAAGLLADPGAGVTRETADVHLVNDGARRGQPQRDVALPVVGGRIDDDAPHRSRGVVTGSPRALAAVVPGNNHAPAVGVEQDLGRVEPQTVCGGRRPLDPVAVDLSRPHTGDEYVPVVVGAIRRRIEPDHAERGGVIFALEQQQLDARGGPREQTEVDAAVHDGGAEG